MKRHNKKRFPTVPLEEVLKSIAQRERKDPAVEMSPPGQQQDGTVIEKTRPKHEPYAVITQASQRKD